LVDSQRVGGGAGLAKGLESKFVPSCSLLPRPAINRHQVADRRPRLLHCTIQVDAVFYARLAKLLRIVIPSWRSKEAGLLVLHSSFLVFRTLLSLYVADLDGKIVSSLVRAQTGAFLKNLVKWVAVAVPATYTNSMLVRPSHLPQTPSAASLVERQI
jgi:hypothetical protein